MIDTILGTKLNQSQTFTSNGRRIPVTHIQTGPLFIVSIRNKKKDGYTAVQLGFGKRRVKITNKSLLGHFKKAGLDKKPPRFLREVKIRRLLQSDIEKEEELEKKEELKPGAMINYEDVLKVGDVVQITGISKGKGFAGVVKRHHFKGGPKTHGQSDRERAPGSIGQTTTPGRVYKGKRMAGRMGSERVTVKNLKVVAIDTKNNILVISGLVPGGRNSLLVIKKIKIS